MASRLLGFIFCLIFTNLNAQVVLDTAKISDHLRTAQEYFNTFDFPKAVEASKLAIAEFAQVPDTMMSLRAEAYRGLGGALVSMGQGETARPAMEMAIKIYQGLEPLDYVSIAQLYSNVGVSHIQSSSRDFKAAVPWFQKAADTIQKSDVPNKNLRTLDYLGNIGLSHFYLNQFDLAEQKYLEALSFMDTPKPEDRTIVAMMEFRLGLLYQRKGNLSASLKQYENALENYQSVTREHPFVGNIYRSLGELYLKKGDYEKALLNAEQARVLFQNLIGQNNEEYISALDAKGDALEALGRWEEVNECDSTILAILNQIYDRPHPSWATNIASAGLRKAEQNNDPTIAVNTLLTVLAQFEKMQDPVEEEIAQYTLELGLAYQKLNQLDLAETTLVNALQLHQKIYTTGTGELVKPHASLAKLYLVQNKDSLSLVHFELAEKAAGLTEPLNVNTISYPVYVAKNMGKKAQLFAKNPLESNLVIADSLYQKGIVILEAIQQSAEAQNSKIGLQNEIIPLLEGRLEVLWRAYQKQPDELLAAQAFQIMERGKSFILLQAVQQSRVDKFASLPDSLLAKRQKIKEDIAFYQKELFLLRQEGEAINQSQEKEWTTLLVDLGIQNDQLTDLLREKYPAYYQLQDDQAELQLRTLQKNLKSDQALVEYFLGEDHIYVLKAASKNAKLYRINYTVSLEDQINNLRISLTNQDAAFTQAAYELYQQLILPLEDLPHNLMIIADGILSYLPFEVLTESVSLTSSNFQELDYMIYNHTISYNFSGALWQEMEEKKYPKKGLLAMAPSFQSNSLQIASRRDQLGPLIFNQPEVKNISKIFKSTTFLDTLATLDNFIEQANDHSILHLATHAKLNEQFSDYSYLAFYGSADSSRSAKLFIRDLYNLRLPLEMVTLSACETGIGKLQKGEGLISLARGFTFAGAKSMVTSLWTANDLSTADIMNRFYKNLKAGLPKDEALRETKLHFLKEKTIVHPYYWATFIPIGDMRPIPQNDWKSNIELLLFLSLIVIGLTLYFRPR